MMYLLYLWPAALLWIIWFFLGWDLVLPLAGGATGVGLFLGSLTRG